MFNTYIRLCPICGVANPITANRCICGGSLAGVDFTIKDTPAPQEQAAVHDPHTITDISLAETIFTNPAKGKIVDHALDPSLAETVVLDPPFLPNNLSGNLPNTLSRPSGSEAEIDPSLAETVVLDPIPALRLAHSNVNVIPSTKDTAEFPIVDVPPLDFSKPAAVVPLSAAPASITPSALTEPVSLTHCPYADCGAANPPGTERCLYCNRPLQSTSQAAAAVAASLKTAPADVTLAEPFPSNQEELPAFFRSRYRLLELKPTTGAEADLLHIVRIEDGVELMLKYYRRGFKPNEELLKVLAQSKRPQVLTAIEQGVNDGRFWEIMEYCPLGNLRTLFKKGPLPGGRIRQMIREIALGLVDIHARKILHRDLKPENVLIRQFDPLQLTLIDFGIASLSDATQVFTSVARSVKYAPPESLTGIVTPKTDWWALGMMAMEASLGRHPFDGLSEQVINFQLATRPIDTSLIVDPDLRKLCRGLLLRDPTKSWGAREVARWLKGDPTLVAPEETGGGIQIIDPYNLGESESRTPRELAVALLKHWNLGLKDWQQGSLRSWVEKELKDQNLLRIVNDLVVDRTMSDDMRLLRFVRACDPKIPLVWKGRAVTLNNLLAAAANRSDAPEAETDAQWLASLYQEKVLTLLNEQEAPELAALFSQWDSAWNDFCAFWKQAAAVEDRWQRRPRQIEGSDLIVARFDDMAYAQSNRMPLPPPRLVYGELLLALSRPQWVDHVRQEVAAGAAEVNEYCAWYIEAIGDPSELPLPSLVAARRLLRYAREDLSREKLQQENLQEQRQGIYNQTRKTVTDALHRVLLATDPVPDSIVGCEHLYDHVITLSIECEKAIDMKAPDAEAAAWIEQVGAMWPYLVELREQLNVIISINEVQNNWIGDMSEMGGIPRSSIAIVVLLLISIVSIMRWSIGLSLAVGLLIFWLWRRSGRTRNLRTLAKAVHNFRSKTLNLRRPYTDKNESNP